MKIFYDHQIFSLQTYGGISRYFFELISSNMDFILSLKMTNNYYLRNKYPDKYMSFLLNYNFKGKNRIISNINKFFTNINITKESFDIFHPTYYDIYFLDIIKNKPFVLTVYDMIHEKFKIFPNSDKISIYKQHLITKASKIITISNSTKKDLMEIYNIDEKKIQTIYLANSISLKDKIVNIELPSKYILFVGNRGLYKNFDLFFESIRELLVNDDELCLVCVGGNKFSKNELQKYNSHLSKRILHFNLSDNELSHFYQNALLFVFPSLYEGFGIPILEAFACKCPLVCSNIDPFLEIAGDGAYYFDPCDKISIKNAVEKIINSDFLRKQLIINGEKRLKNFSWNKTVYETKKLYESLV
ncbi:MAG: glycosyltransferase family 4 protein [Campylobacteraceae bacterium]|jgi:glycosyltransferase involved in cell wall biosynthesis|nr:glycosyltransferase family 4 protein [Campylobacteraceae bacterium]